MHTYTVMHVYMQFERPLTFSDGERIVAVLESKPSLANPHGMVELTVLVELPATAGRFHAGAQPRT